MDFDLSGIGEIVRPSRDVVIRDVHGEATGLVFTVVPKTDEKYQKTQRWAQDQFATGKKIPVAKKREIGDKLFMARISGWKWEEPAKTKVGSPPFNPKNLKSVLYDQGEYSASIREQLTEAIGDDEDFLPEE